MAWNRCNQCGHRFQTLDDEFGEHPCPRCNWYPGIEDDLNEE